MFVKSCLWKTGKEKIVETDFLRECERAVKAGCEIVWMEDV